MTEAAYGKLFDLVTEVRDSVIRTETHLETLDGQVVKHTKQIDDLKTTDTQILTQFNSILEHVNEEKERAKKRSDFWYERVVWILGLFGLAVLNAVGVINFTT